jgi:hypothetical protein
MAIASGITISATVYADDGKSWDGGKSWGTANTGFSSGTVPGVTRTNIRSNTGKPITGKSLRLTAADFSSGTMRGFTLTNMRPDGGDDYVESDYADLSAMKVNLTRVFLHLTKCDGCSSYAFPEAEVAHVEHILQQGERYGFKVVVALEPMPAYAKSDYWKDDNLRKSIALRWQQIAARLQQYHALAAYDLINEPVPPHGVLDGMTLSMQQQMWRDFATSLITSIRAVDPQHVIIFEPAPWAFASDFKNLEPLPYSNIVYSFHLYQPHEFTHQGLPDTPYGINYPSSGWNKSTLSNSVEPIRAFVRKTGAPVYVGEFSATRWAPNDSAARYLKDAIEIFEAEKWSWTYLGWRGYQGWDAEIPYTVSRELKKGIVPEARAAHTPSMDLMRSYFSLNKSR